MGKSKKKLIILGCLVLTLVGGISYNIVSKSNKLEEPKQEKKGMLAMYIEDESGSFQLSNSKTFPKEGYILDHAECGRSDSEVTQDSETKKISAKFSHVDSCNLYFAVDKCPKSALYITTTLANGLKVYDSSAISYNECNTKEMYTFDHDEATQTTGWSAEERRDYRYIGANPNNWIKFNDENWRIIGVFTVEKTDGTKEQLIKIIRNGSIENNYWASNNINEWPSSSLKTLLNSGDYYNRANTYASTGLNETARSQIAEVKWYLGGSNTSSLGGPNYYGFERGETVYSGRSTNTFAKVGLIYPSDYLYTYANGVDDKCYKSGYYCQTSSGGTPSNGWLYSNYMIQWTISPAAGNSNYAFLVSSAGYIDGNFVDSIRAVRPVVYLSSDIKIISGDGASWETAYVLSEN